MAVFELCINTIQNNLPQVKWYLKYTMLTNFDTFLFLLQKFILYVKKALI